MTDNHVDESPSDDHRELKLFQKLCLGLIALPFGLFFLNIVISGITYALSAPPEGGYDYWKIGFAGLKQAFLVGLLIWFIWVFAKKKQTIMDGVKNLKVNKAQAIVLSVILPVAVLSLTAGFLGIFEIDWADFSEAGFFYGVALLCIAGLEVWLWK